MAVKKATLTQHLIFHSDRGIQYASHKFTSLIKSYEGLVKQSISRKVIARIIPLRNRSLNH